MDFVVDIKITLLIMSLIQHSLFCNRAIGAFLTSAFAMPQVGLDSLIAESDTSIIRVYLQFHFLIPISKHNLVNHVFNTALTS